MSGIIDVPRFEVKWGDATFEASHLYFRELEKWMMVTALKLAGNNQTAAARLLGLTRDQVRYRMDKHGIKVPR